MHGTFHCSWCSTAPITTMHVHTGLFQGYHKISMKFLFFDKFWIYMYCTLLPFRCSWCYSAVFAECFSLCITYAFKELLCSWNICSVSYRVMGAYRNCVGV